MTRRRIVAVLCGVLSYSSIAAAGVMPGPGITGTVEGGSSSVVQVYADDGDGTFSPFSDSLINSVTTDGSGAYQFDNLDMEMDYFVYTNGESSLAQRIGDVKYMIDSFDISQSVIANPNTGFRLSSTTGPAASIIGGFRDLYLDILSGPADGMLRSNPFSRSSNLQIDMSAGVTSMVSVTWDGVAGSDGIIPDSALDMDFTADGMYHGISLGLAADRAGEGQVLELHMHSPSGTSTANVVFPYDPNVSPQQLSFVPFSAFVGDADPTDVSAFQMMIDETMPSLDAQINVIGLTGPNEVNFKIAPEPSSFLMLIFGLIGIGQFRRRVQ